MPVKKRGGFVPVKKFQKTETLIQKIVLRYAEGCGKTDAIKGSHDTKIVGFYSPVGGTEATALALATAVTAATSGVRT